MYFPPKYPTPITLVLAVSVLFVPLLVDIDVFKLFCFLLHLFLRFYDLIFLEVFILCACYFVELFFCFPSTLKDF